VATLLTRAEDGVLIAYFQDVRIIDESRINSLGQELTDLINNSDNNKIILNFQNVSFMSSAMIGKLVLFGKKCKAAKVDLRMCNINENVEEVFNLMKLGKVFAIDKTEEASKKNISKKSWFGG
jgi:anti-anti-sigma factor